jgi:hypothetical protein
MMFPSPKGIRTLSLRLQWRFVRVIVLFIPFYAIGSSALAACHAVTASGSGARSGTDWNNAYAGLPSTLVRGDIYYLADGTYSTNGTLGFSTAASGSTTIEIRKAQSYDNGSNCDSSIAAGWNTSTMGSGQARFTGSPALRVTAPYLTMNGNGTSTASGCGGAPGTAVNVEPPTPSDCGIALIGFGNSSSGANNIVSYQSTNLTLNYIELVGSGLNANDLEIFGYGTSNLTINHMYGRNSGCVYIQDIGDDSVVDHSYFWGTEVYGATGGCHGQAEFEGGTTSNGVRSNNVYRDITGTAIWTFALPSGTNTGWIFYNNVIFNSSPSASWSPFVSDGILACINSGVTCNEFTMVQNTVINENNPGINNENTGSYTVQNNLYYGNNRPPSFNKGSNGSYTQDHNSMLASGKSCPSGTSNVCDNSAQNPFTNWKGSVFTLASENADWNNRASLNPPYNTDAAGNPFTTDRGAYQFGSAIAPSAPVALSATVQ